MFTTFSNKEIAIESKEILAKLFQENENIEINKSIVDKFCYIMDKSSTKDIQKYSILINQMQNIEYENNKFQNSEEELLDNYKAGLFDSFDLGQIFYKDMKDMPDNFQDGSNYWSKVLGAEFYNAFAKNYIQLAKDVNPNYAKDILNFVIAENLDKRTTVNLKIKLNGFNNEYCEDLKNRLNKIPTLVIEDDDKEQLFSQLDNIINKGEISQEALCVFNVAKKNARDFNLIDVLDNAIKIIVQLNGYDLNKLSEINK